MRCPMIALPLVALAMPVQAQDGPTESENTIVVSGKRLDDALADLEACLDRGCPPEEDIQLSLQVAEIQFIDGDYQDGQRVLRSSISRTKKHSDKLPVPVAGLYRASARFAEHMGEAKDFQLSTLDMRDTLRGGLGKEDWRTLVADITVGDSRAKLGQPDDAERIYKRTEKRALELGHNRVAMYARLRQALLNQARFDASKQDTWRDRMREQLIDIRDNPLAGGEEFVLPAEVMLARLDRETGTAQSTEELIKRFAENGGVERPILIFSKPLYTDADLDRERQRAGNASARLATLSRNNPTWIDIGFWIDQEGRVSDVEILRSEGNLEWTSQVLRHIRSRVYAPLDAESVGPGLYQVERYTVTSRFADQTTGTRLRKREPIQRIERLDITPENYTGQDGSAG